MAEGRHALIIGGSLGGLFAAPGLQPVLARLYGWLADHRQGLSRLGLTGLFGHYLHLLARRAARRDCSVRTMDEAGA